MAFSLPPLPYAHDALEPHIDAETMRIHHGKHHQAYTDNLNAALEGTEWADRPIEETLADLDALPEGIRTKVRNNGGGFFNHGIFWTTMGPDGGGEPTGELGRAIGETFGSFDAFKEQFAATATGQFGSGWAWLAYGPDAGLHLHGMPNQDNPVMHGHAPILGVDVWEHAYYLHYQNKRADYVKAWWNVVNWDEADRRYREAKAQLG
jgi:Fe-Mn family superoxide dismutase